MSSCVSELGESSIEKESLRVGQRSQIVEPPC